MKLSHVQRSRFVACIEDLKKLVTLAKIAVPGTKIENEKDFVRIILDHLKEVPIGQYRWFDLNEDLDLRLKVSKRGVIMGCVSLTGISDTTRIVRFRLNQFIEGSMLRDPDIEYYESA